MRSKRNPSATVGTAYSQLHFFSDFDLQCSDDLADPSQTRPLIVCRLIVLNFLFVQPQSVRKLLLSPAAGDSRLHQRLRQVVERGIREHTASARSQVVVFSKLAFQRLHLAPKGVRLGLLEFRRQRAGATLLVPLRQRLTKLFNAGLGDSVLPLVLDHGVSP